MTNISICPLLSDIVKHWELNWQRFSTCRFFGPSTTYLHKQTKEELQELVWFGQPSARWNDFDRVPCLRGWQFLGTSACFKQTGLSLLAPCQLEAMVIKVGLFSSLKYNPRGGEAHILYSIIIQCGCCWLIPHTFLATAINCGCLCYNSWVDGMAKYDGAAKILHQTWLKPVPPVAKSLMAFAKRGASAVVNTNLSQIFMSLRGLNSRTRGIFFSRAVILPDTETTRILSIQVRISWTESNSRHFGLDCCDFYYW